MCDCEACEKLFKIMERMKDEKFILECEAYEIILKGKLM